MSRPSGNCGGLGPAQASFRDGNADRKSGHSRGTGRRSQGNPARHRSPERKAMIVKKLNRTSFKKSKATMIGGLVDYILAEHDDNGKDKLAYAGSRNFLTTTVAAQKREMISLPRNPSRAGCRSRTGFCHGRKTSSPPANRWTRWSVSFSGEWVWPSIRRSMLSTKTRATITCTLL